jgi:hypothetical protein
VFVEYRICPVESGQQELAQPPVALVRPCRCDSLTGRLPLVRPLPPQRQVRGLARPATMRRTLALQVLVRLRLIVPTEPAQQTSDDQEFLMNTQDIVETWRREAIQEGLEQGERKVLLRQLRRRFGAEVDGEIERRVAVAPVEQVEVWTERVLSAATLAELLAD